MQTWFVRNARVPMCVRVDVEGRLADAWCLNISGTGLGITGTGEAVPEVGTLLSLGLELPDSTVTLRLQARVQWVQHRGLRVMLGAAFERLGSVEQALIDAYVSHYRPRIALLHAQAEEVTRLSSLTLDFDVHAVAHAAEVLEGGAPFAAVALLGRDTETAVASLRVLHAVRPDSLEALRRVALEPRIIFAAPCHDKDLLKLHNDGQVFRSVPYGDRAALLRAMHDAIEDFTVRSEMQRLARAYSPARLDTEPALPEMICESEAMHDVLALVHRVALPTIPVLLTGETGTGKELLARAIHRLSPRANAPFVAQDCGAVTETLLESELFGHVKGAFTGAVSNHPGLFAFGNGGTVFLDEIENISPVFQAKLLRVLETGEIRPVGSAASKRVDVRVIAATNLALRAEVAAGRFRPDLFYRLDRFSIEVPPLRLRQRDILPLGRHFLRQALAELRIDAMTLSTASEQLLLAYPWPGNVRELRNAIERAALMSAGRDELDARTLPAPVRAAAPAPTQGTLRAQLADYEKRLIADALQAHAGVVTHAARTLGMDAVTLSRRAKRLGLRLGLK